MDLRGLHFSLMTVSKRIQEWVHPKYRRNQHFHQTPNQKAPQHQENSAGLAEQGLTGCFVHSPSWEELSSNTAEAVWRSCSA